MSKRISIFALAALMVMASVGCVTKSAFRDSSEAADARTSSVESAVEANERRIADMGKETDAKIASLEETAEKAVEVGNSAMGRADEAAMKADKAARGKLIWSVTLSDESVTFGFNNSSVPDDAAAALDDLIRKVKALDKAVYIEIEGHTDNMGGEQYNYELGQQRADAVRDYMSQAGIPLHAMNTISRGEANPVADNGDLEGRTKNRRVVIRVLE
jgi:outer membrane protein OmpA-like peptidoglycan-associated protein